MKTFQNIIIGALAFIGIVGMVFGIWYAKRTINYSFQYESMVQKQIDESLKNYKCDCKCDYNLTNSTKVK